MLKSSARLFCGPQIRRFANFLNRDFMFTDPASRDGVITNFARHVVIKEAKNMEDPVQYNIRYADYFPVSDVRNFVGSLAKVPTDNLPRMVVFASVFRSRSEIPVFVQVVNQLDNECASRIEDMPFRQIIELLNAFMYMIPDKMAQLDFYRLAMKRLVEQFTGDPDDLVKVLFYLGLWKHRATDLVNQLVNRHIESSLPSLSSKDFAIIANVTYRTATLVRSDMFKERLVEEVSGASDPTLLVNLVKTCRHQSVKSAVIVDRIRRGVEKGDFERANMEVLTHLFSYVTSNLIDDDELVVFFTSKITRLLTADVRTKDMSSFLWSCAQVGLNLKKEGLEQIDQILDWKVQNGDYERFPDELVNSCLALFMLGHTSEHSLTLEAPHRKNFKMVQHQKEPFRLRQDSRRILLQNCISIEKGKRLQSQPAPEHLVRPSLRQVQEELGEGSFELAIPELNIAGVVKDGVNFEVLDSSNTTSSGKPIGLMKLKLRLLRDLGLKVQEVNVLAPEWKESLKTNEENNSEK